MFVQLNCIVLVPWAPLYLTIAYRCPINIVDSIIIMGHSALKSWAFIAINSWRFIPTATWRERMFSVRMSFQCCLWFREFRLQGTPSKGHVAALLSRSLEVFNCCVWRCINHYIVHTILAAQCALTNHPGQLNNFDFNFFKSSRFLSFRILTRALLYT